MQLQNKITSDDVKIASRSKGDCTQKSKVGIPLFLFHCSMQRATIMVKNVGTAP